ncbi:hypothetical protein [Massilia sp. BJB1822]|uniref:hypothetical protein n=1 Tax=Massilia sp. BJB1822 TaxID=2744470 RepID=UPI0015940EB9|nr:hypothetical protein [Massilia sp. BJB1822]NVD98509.1 hypothetical protein [Massilia sp. BJB1822]
MKPHALLALLLGASQSAGAAALDPQFAATLNGQTVQPTQRPAPRFTAFSAGNALFGVFGALSSVSSGDKLVADNQIEDPTPRLSRTLAQRLAASYGMLAAPQALAVDDSDNAALAAPAPNSRLLVDVQGSWKFAYLGLDTSHYQVEYGARAKLIDTATKKVVANANCQAQSDRKLQPPTYDEMLANQAARLKRALAVLSEACGEQLSHELLGQPAQPVALTLPFAPLTVDDPVPNLSPKGQERFRLFLQKPLPRAFAISDNGYSVSVAGTHPENPALPTDPRARALQLCQDYAHRACQLYMVDDKIVYGSH